jgi:hypothetical protein
VGFDEREEALLELAACERRADAALREDRLDHAGPPTAWVALHQVSEGEAVVEPASVGFLDSALDLALRQHRCEVEQGAWDGRRRNAALDRDFVGRQLALVDRDRRPLWQPALDRHLGCAPSGRPDLPQRGRGAVTQDRPFAGRKHCCHPTSLP